MSSNIEKNMSSYFMLEIRNLSHQRNIFYRIGYSEIQNIKIIEKKADNYVRALTAVKTLRSALSARGSAKRSKDSSKRNLNFMAV